MQNILYYFYRVLGKLYFSVFVLPYPILYADSDVDETEEFRIAQDESLSVPVEADAVILETNDIER